jgi:hypothetical protein
MPDFTVAQHIDDFMKSSDNTDARSELGIPSLSTFAYVGDLGSAAFSPTSAFETPAGTDSKIDAAIDSLPPSGSPLTLIDLNGDNDIYGYALTEIPNAWQENGSLTVAQIGSTVTSIGSNAFYYCSNLTDVTISDSVTTIGNYAFYYTYITAITLPDSLTSIGGYAFKDCTSLTSVTFGDSLTSIGSGAFYNCSSLTSITIPDSVTSIGIGAFTFCTSLTEANIYVTKTIIDAATNLFQSSGLATIYARASDATWTEGTGLTIGGATGVEVIKNL